MRFAFLLTALPLRRHLEAGPIDAEGLLALAADHDLELFVDQATEGSEMLRRSGLPVTISLKRPVEGSDGHKASADALQARALARLHVEAPFDALVYGSDRSLDLAVHEPGLRPIPRIVGLGAGFPHDLRAVWQDRRIFARLARTLHAATGFVSSADFLLSDVPPAAFGLADDGHLPPWLGASDLVGSAPPEPLADDDPRLAAARWIAVAATALGLNDAETLVERLVARLHPGPHTTLLIAIRPPLPDADPIDEAILRGCPEALRSQVVIAATGDDGVAHDFFEAADLVVAATPAELAVRGVAEAARRSGLLLLETPSPEPPIRPSVGTFPGSLEADEPPRGARPVRREGLRILTWEGTADDMARILEGIGRDLESGEMAADDLLVLHAVDRAEPAVDLFALSDLGGVDLVTWARPGYVLGEPNPDHLYPWALAVRAAAVPALARATGRCRSTWELICWAVSSEWLDRLRWLVLPAPEGADLWEPTAFDAIGVRWQPCSGVLPAPRWLAAPPPDPFPAPVPLPAYLPRRRFIAKPTGAPRPVLETWARQARWSQRVRLALPWRWGLLERAMEGEW